MPSTATPALGATILGYPRIGPRRELKRALEAYWRAARPGRADATEQSSATQAADTRAHLLEVAAELRASSWQRLTSLGLDSVPCNDFTLYDHMLDTAVLVGAVPARFVPIDDPLDRYFAMARGTGELAPLEMTKWFDTNYHYLVPEIGPDTTFELDPAKPLEELAEASEGGHRTRPVVVGPVTFLKLAKAADDAPEGFDPLSRLDDIVPLYADLLSRLAAAGADWVQLDEPILVTDLPADELDRVRDTYATLAAASNRPKILVASYFDRLGDALAVLADAPIDGIALDLTGRAATNLDALRERGGLPGKRLVAGLINGRNIWTADLDAALRTAEQLVGLAERVDIASSCSLLHVPLDTANEKDLDPAFDGWFAFARQKLAEVVTVQRSLAEGRDAVAAELSINAEHRAARASSPLVKVAAVRDRVAAVADDDLHRRAAYEDRAVQQRDWLKLPKLPTTTIGSFPQTDRLRKARAGLRRGELTAELYAEEMRREVAAVIADQEKLGLDVLVHGEPERNDMVQYFAEQLDGFIATQQGWVQSYGSRYVRPPIIVGDVSRPEPMTVEWATYAQSLTQRPVKGMLTGPVTMLAWSFVRDDQPEGDTAQQVALALRDEVADLESAGIGVIQVDEPALRETLPLRSADRADYLDWAVRSFQLSTAGVADRTQIHTHMCYAEFGDVLGAIIAMDADVISLEAARSKMAIVADLAAAQYPNEVGPGVWDIHSPRVPSTEEITDQLRTAYAAFGERAWVNPDCGLKTRGYAEVNASLANLVAAAREVRAGEYE